MEEREEYAAKPDSDEFVLQDTASAAAFYYQELQRAGLPEWLAASLLRDWHVEQCKAAFSPARK